ncbi:MAG TPA: hypothetical protein VIY48_08750 [Candidatus Paceibacterota bacterium]
MADDKAPAHNPLRDLYFFIAFLVVVVILWYASGGPKRADLRGAFIGGPSWNDTSGAQQDPTFQGGSVAPPPQVQY